MKMLFFFLPVYQNGLFWRSGDDTTIQPANPGFDSPNLISLAF